MIPHPLSLTIMAMKKLLQNSYCSQLRLPLHVILFIMWWRFPYVIKMMSGIENILNDKDFLVDKFYTTKESVA